MWVGLVQLIEGLKSKDKGFWKKKKLCLKTATEKPCLNFQPNGLPYRVQTQDYSIDSYLCFNLAGLPTSFRLTTLHSCVNSFLKNLSLSAPPPTPFLCPFLSIYILLVLFLWITTTNAKRLHSNSCYFLEIEMPKLIFLPNFKLLSPLFRNNLQLLLTL